MIRQTFRPVVRQLSSASQKRDSNQLLKDAIELRDAKTFKEIILDYDPYEFRKEMINLETSKSRPNLVPSNSEKRVIGCVCEPGATAINWVEIERDTPYKCYCGHWFKLVGYEDFIRSKRMKK